MPSNSPVDLNVFKMQMVYVYTAANVFIDVWRDAPLLSGFKEAINAAIAPMDVILPRAFDSFDVGGVSGNRGSIAQGNIVKYYLYGPGLPATGKLRYSGIIDAFSPSIADTGEETVTVTLVPQSSALGDHGVTTPVTFGTSGSSSTYVDTVSQFNWFFTNNDGVYTGKPFTTPLTLAAGNPSSSGQKTQYAYTAENLQSIFQTILQMSPVTWYYAIRPDNTVYFGPQAATAQHIFSVGQHISSINYKEDWTALKNCIYMTGATNSSGVQLQGHTIGSDVSTFGQRLALYNDTRVTDQTTLNTILAWYLGQLDTMQLRATVRVLDYRGDNNTGLGYDIETLQVGDTVQIINPTQAGANSYSGGLAEWDMAVWDSAQWDFSPGGAISQIVQIAALTYGFDYVDLELATLQPSQDTQLFFIRRAVQDYTMVR